MINKNRVVRALAGLAALAVVGGLSAAATPQLAAADAKPSAHLTKAVLLDTDDLTHAGWKVPETGVIDSDDGDLLGQCAGPTPDLAPGFVQLKATGLYTGAEDLSAGGAEFVLAFKTNDEARNYFRDYRAAIEGHCLDLYGPKKWNVTRSARVTLDSDRQHARTWLVKDHVAGAVVHSVTMVRVGNRIALVWLDGWQKTNPAKSLDLRWLTQIAADRITP